jgi:hypothetical protein
MSKRKLFYEKDFDTSFKKINNNFNNYYHYDFTKSFNMNKYEENKILRSLSKECTKYNIRFDDFPLISESEEQKLKNTFDKTTLYNDICFNFYSSKVFFKI